MEAGGAVAGAERPQRGSCKVHSGVPNTQRGWKRQPGGTRPGGGRVPSITSRRARSSSMRGMLPRRPSVYGCCGSSKIAATGARSTTRPAYITATSSAMPATTPRSCVISTIAMPVSRWISRSRSSTWACTVTSSAVVGSSAISRSGEHASAIAIITRWRMPPESWCG